MKKISLIAIVLCVAVLLCSCGGKVKSGGKTSSEEKQILIEDLKAKNIYDDSIDNDYISDNKVTMVNVWGTFCTPCLNEMPYIEELYQEYKSEGFNVLGIVIDTVDSSYNPIDSKVHEAVNIVEELDISYENAIPNKKLFEGEMASNQFIPVTYFVDSDGRMLTDKYVGAKSFEEWEEIIKSLLEGK